MRLRHGAPASLASPQKSHARRQACMEDELADPLLDPETIRGGLQVALVMFSLFELSFWWDSKWMWCTLLLSNGWGWFDAVQRFPRPPAGIESCFAMKQGTLMAMKIVFMVVNIKRVQFDPFVFIGLVFWNLVLPLLYMLLLPFHHRREREEEESGDLGLLLLQFACSPQQHRAVMVHAVAWVKTTAVSVTRPYSPVFKLTRLVVTTLSPRHRRYVQKQASCRVV